MPQNSLEQEAMDRVRRMYSSFDSRTRRPENRSVNRPVKSAEADAEKHSAVRSDQSAAEKPAAQRSDPKSVKQNSLLDVFLKGGDQSLILLLLVLLMRDGADTNLMLALMYLLI